MTASDQGSGPWWMFSTMCMASRPTSAVLFVACATRGRSRSTITIAFERQTHYGLTFPAETSAVAWKAGVVRVVLTL